MNIEYKSQFGQDKWIMENLFRGMTHGFFVDIGAGDGQMISNTWVMEKHFQWDGICIDPCGVTLSDLKKNRKCKVDDVLILDHDGEEDFFEVTSKGYFDSYFSSTSKPPDYPQFEIKRKRCEKLYTTLNRLRSCTLIHYMSIDTEGTEYSILKQFFEDEYLIDKEPWKRRVISLSVEHNFEEEKRELIKNLLTEYHYTHVTSLGVDDIYVHSIYDVLCKNI